ncbi:ribonuclease G [Oceanicola sp. 22II-s10i]|uniref:ribonuclease E/G n=1 Tax=Oceanicola sp. 22II-s10i TaxID=1317116 RepID=UPI000B524A3B|nr:ribonuclease E/G [Oceanicola sp. 22II-s10i]OWU84100.1 ribonuclease G [Oceanicola sp. 22II-s10i]
MKGMTILLGEWNGAEAAALLRDGRLEDLVIDTDAPRPGTIYRAKADRPVKGQGGMFLSTPDGSAFLRQVKGLSPGEPILVQVTGHAEPGKAIPVTSRILFKSRHAIVTPGAPGLNVSRAIRDEARRDDLLALANEVLAGHPVLALDPPAGLILRSAAEAAEDHDIATDIAAMADLCAAVLGDLAGQPEKLVEGDGPHDFAWRDWPDAPVDDSATAFADHDVATLIEALHRPEVRLSGGASMWIEPTRAMVAVDVNTGGDTSPAAGLKANLAAARDLPRQLRLRGLGGQIVIDPAPMPKKDRKSFEGALRAALKGEQFETVLAGWTQMGLYELQRQRARAPLPPLTDGPA